MKSDEIRSKFLKFFEKRGHNIIQSASLVPENDNSVLFTIAGMQPLLPYILGKKHPNGQRLVNSQKCIRTQDINDVGDNTHDTFFEMLGNWSFGNLSAEDGIGKNGYFKKEAILWSYEFLISKNEGLGLDPKKLYITLFEGDDGVLRDDEAVEIWMSVGISRERIYFMDAKSNWWKMSENGPCGPDTEMHYSVGEITLGNLSKDEFIKASTEQKIVEIWNDVFMEYEMKDGKVVGKLNQKNIDTGAGLERLAMVVQGVNNIFETDLFAPLIKIIRDNSRNIEIKSERIVADHIRTAVFLISDGVEPSNTDRGYVLRRLVRRFVRYADKLGLSEEVARELIDCVGFQYKNVYPEILNNIEKIKKIILHEEKKFKETLNFGLKKFEKLKDDKICGRDAFILFSTFGFPIELTEELALENNQEVDRKGFDEEFKKHQELSKISASKKFKGGLAGSEKNEIKYHTATHLLNASLKKILGGNVSQKGSNITSERLRFDFLQPRKMTEEEIAEVEKLVNKKIEENLPVVMREMSIDEARNIGAEGVFDKKYENIVKVYEIGDEKNGIFSREICGGPHIKNTGELGKFKIKKEEAVSSGIRRIKAILE